MKNIELINANLLEDYQDEISNRGSEVFSNGDGLTTDQKAKIGEAGVKLAAAIAANKAAKLAVMANTGCTPPPFFDFGSKKRAAYLRCLAIAQQNADAKEAAANAIAREQMASTERIAMANARAGVVNPDSGDGKKFLYMPQTAGIIVTVIGSIGLIVGTIIIIKKFA